VVDTTWARELGDVGRYRTFPFTFKFFFSWGEQEYDLHVNFFFLRFMLGSCDEGECSGVANFPPRLFFFFFLETPVLITVVR